MPDFIGGIPLGPVGPPDYVNEIPSGQQTPITPGAFDPVSPASPPTNFTYPPQPAGVVIIGAGMTVGYVRDRGLRGAPVAGPYGTQSAFWRVHGGLVYKVVTGVFQAIGGAPSLPSPVTNNNEILLYDAPTLPADEVLPDGTCLYIRGVQFIFMLQCPPSDADVLYGCIIQMDATSISANVINPADYVPNLLGPIPAPAGYSGNIVNY